MEHGVILASTSKYRAAALDRLALSYQQMAPDVDECIVPGEAAAARSARLSQAKCLAVAGKHPNRIVIGSDQVGTFSGGLLSKPGSKTAQIAQLGVLSGGEATFFTSVSVWDPASQRCLTYSDQTNLKFRPLSNQAIQSYVEQEPAYDCAGGFKIEGRGIRLVEYVRTDDPSALVGLPLIGLYTLLGQIARIPG